MASLRRLVASGGLVAVLGLAGLAAVQAPAQALPPSVMNVIQVSDTCSVQDALNSAQRNEAVGGCSAGVVGVGEGADHVVIPAGTYTGDFVVPAPTVPGDGLLVSGAGVGDTTLTAERLTTLRVGNGVVEINGLTITGGVGLFGIGDYRGGGPAGAGGVINYGDLTLDNVTISGNKGGRGGLGENYGARGGDGGPGGIGNYGTLTLLAVTVTNNTGSPGIAGTEGRRGTCFPDGCIPAVRGGDGGDGGVGGLLTYPGGRTLVSDEASITGNTGGAGGAGSYGGGGDTYSGPEGDKCTEPASGGNGGRGGAGGVSVQSNGQSGDASVVSGNTGAAGGAGGAAGTDGCGEASDGSVGSPGISQISKGGQTTSWVQAPPTDASTGEQFSVEAASSVASLVPQISVDGDCLSDGGEVTITGSFGQSCTVSADQPGNGWYNAAAQLSATVSITDSSAPTLSPTVTPNPATLNGPAIADSNADDTGSGVDESTVECTQPTTAAIGIFVVTCSASDLAGNASEPESATYTVTAPIRSVLSPLPKATVKRSSTLPVKFTLSDAAGRLSNSASSALASNQQVRVVLTKASDASDTLLATATCTWDTRNSNFACSLKIPPVKPIANPYHLTIQERGVGGTVWFAAGGADSQQVSLK